jgi:nitrogen regulatory protein P-II 1
MKLVTAVIRPEKLEDVTHAVIDLGARGMTVAGVRGFGQRYGQVAEAYPADRSSLLLRKLRIDVVVGDQEAALVVDAIAKSVRTGATGCGSSTLTNLASAARSPRWDGSGSRTGGPVHWPTGTGLAGLADRSRCRPPPPWRGRWPTRSTRTV